MTGKSETVSFRLDHDMIKQLSRCADLSGVSKGEYAKRLGAWVRFRERQRELRGFVHGPAGLAQRVTPTQYGCRAGTSR